jgi:hypothetical protein
MMVYPEKDRITIIILLFIRWLTKFKYNQIFPLTESTI